ncbi:MAG: DUF3368 domain-containing protein, partial [Candidatus Methylomirabilis sp.]|nr:DUF3368 domain-containing protein [Deltaproteobacteria bacterium]
MIVVSNTSPLNYLVLLERQEVLPDLFGQVRIPTMALTELGREGAPPVVRRWADAPPPWLVVQEPTEFDPRLRLHLGETHAIALAQTAHADVLLMDEARARGVAGSMGLRVRGTLSVLELAAERDLLDLPAALRRLRETNFRASAGLIDAALE